MDGTPKIKIRGLKKSFGGRRVLAGVDLDVPAGRSVVLLGPSAAGKTVLLKCICGLIVPDEGSIEIDGVETVGLGSAARDALMRKVGVVFQSNALFDSLPTWRNVAFGLLSRGAVDRKDAKRIAVEKLAAVGLSADAADLLPVALSGGMQKRVALARAIATDPEILLLDDPTAGLDPIVARMIDLLIADSLRGTKVTALIITQNLDTARRVADFVAVLSEGRIVWQGAPDAPFPAEDAVIRRYVGGLRDAAA
ncbi:MAG: ABC transporter ATP-binding protein [Alphaproteobacteria bacterium]